MCTDKLILATGATALEHVDWPERSQNTEIKQKMETSTIDIPAVKVNKKQIHLVYIGPTE